MHSNEKSLKNAPTFMQSLPQFVMNPLEFLRNIRFLSQHRISLKMPSPRAVYNDFEMPFNWIDATGFYLLTQLTYKNAICFEKKRRNLNYAIYLHLTIRNAAQARAKWRLKLNNAEKSLLRASKFSFISFAYFSSEFFSHLFSILFSSFSLLTLSNRWFSAFDLRSNGTNFSLELGL